MDESTTVAAPAAPEGGDVSETTTPEEVASVLGLERPAEETAPDAPEEEAPEEETPTEEVPAVTPAEEPRVEEPAAPEAAAGDEPTFTVEVEDANGEKFAINPGDNLEEVLAAFEPKNNGQIFQIVKESIKQDMAKEAFDAQKAEEASAAEVAQSVAAVQDGWDKEIAKLQGEKRLETTADGKPNERAQAVFKFMADENEGRQADGRPLLQSFEDALDKMELQDKRDAEKEAAKKAKEEARRVGGMVGGSSAPASSGAPVYHAGAARNANEALHHMGVL